MLNWNYSFDEFEISSHDGFFGFALKRGVEEGAIRMWYGDTIFAVDPADIASVSMMEPKFFKKGFVAFLDEDGELLKYTVDGKDDILLGFQVSRKQKDAFYAFFSLMKENGFEIVAN